MGRECTDLPIATCRSPVFALQPTKFFKTFLLRLWSLNSVKSLSSFVRSFWVWFILKCLRLGKIWTLKLELLFDSGLK